jgi:putative ABC transport system permease protein
VNLFKLAWRNVWRNRRRSVVTMAAMSLALFVMILYSGLVDGYLVQMERSILDLEVGDLQIHAADYRDNPSIYTRIDDADAVLSKLDAAGYQASGRVLAFGLAAAGESSAGISFRGVDVERDARVSRIGREVALGRWIEESDPKGVVIGRRLARTLGVELGSEIVVLTQGADGATAYDLFLVRGVLRSVADGTDRTAVFMTEAALRELVGVPDGVHQIIVRVPAGTLLADAASGIAGVGVELDVKTWRQLLPTLSSLLESTRGVMIVMYLLIYIAIAILILNAMLMAVFERIRELGVLKALGVGPFAVLRMILIESGIQTLIATVVGVGLGIPAMLYLERYGIDLASLAGVSILGIAMDPVWRASVNVENFTQPVAVLVGIVGLAVLYPACKAAWIRPVEAMRHH